MMSELSVVLVRANITRAAAAVSNGPNIMAPWLLPVTVGVTMVTFLMISFAIHHRQFLQQRRRSLKFYNIHGQRVASPSIPSRDLLPPPGIASTTETASDMGHSSPRKLASRLMDMFKYRSSPPMTRVGHDPDGQDARNDFQFGQNEPTPADPSSWNGVTPMTLSSWQGRSSLKGRPFVVTTLSGILTRANLKPSDLLVAYESCDDLPKFRERRVHVTSTATQWDDSDVPGRGLVSGQSACSESAVRGLVSGQSACSESPVNDETKASSPAGAKLTIRAARENFFAGRSSSESSGEAPVDGNKAGVAAHDFPSSVEHSASSGERRQYFQRDTGSSTKTSPSSDACVISLFENTPGVHDNNALEIKHAKKCGPFKTETVESLLTMGLVTNKLRALLGDSPYNLEAKTLTLTGSKNRSSCAECNTCDAVKDALAELSEDHCKYINEFLENIDRIGRDAEVRVGGEDGSEDGESQLGEVSGHTFGTRTSEIGSWGAGSGVVGVYVSMGELTSLHNVVQ